MLCDAVASNLDRMPLELWGTPVSLCLKHSGIEVVKNSTIKRDLLAFLKKDKPSSNESEFYTRVLDIAAKEESVLRKIDQLNTDKEVSDKVK